MYNHYIKNPEFISFTRKNGRNEFIDFLNSLSKKDREKLLLLLNKVRDNGMLLAQKMQWVKKIDDNLYELRSKLGTNIQRVIYFHAYENKYVITHGFTKKTQRTPVIEISRAIRIRQEYYEYLEKKDEERN